MNGVGYDAWADKIMSAAPGPPPIRRVPSPGGPRLAFFEEGRSDLARSSVDVAVIRRANDRPAPGLTPKLLVLLRQ